jgi:hypothetical protein
MNRPSQQATPANQLDRAAEPQGLLLVDLLRLHQSFSFRRYREDLIGFLIAWVVVAALIALAQWSVWVGS